MKTSKLISRLKDKQATHYRWVYLFLEKLIKNFRKRSLIYKTEDSPDIILLPTETYKRDGVIYISIKPTTIKEHQTFHVQHVACHDLYTIEIGMRFYCFKYIIAIKNNRVCSDSVYANIPERVSIAYSDNIYERSDRERIALASINSAIYKTITEFDNLREEAIEKARVENKERIDAILESWKYVPYDINNKKE